MIKYTNIYTLSHTDCISQMAVTKMCFLPHSPRPTMQLNVAVHLCSFCELFEALYTELCNKTEYIPISLIVPKYYEFPAEYGGISQELWTHKERVIKRTYIIEYLRIYMLA